MYQILVSQTLEQRQLTQEAQRTSSLGMLHHKLKERGAIQRPHGDVRFGHNGCGTCLRECEHRVMSVGSVVLVECVAFGFERQLTIELWPKWPRYMPV